MSATSALEINKRYSSVETNRNARVQYQVTTISDSASARDASDPAIWWSGCINVTGGAAKLLARKSLGSF